MKAGFKIQKMFAFVATDKEGTEGVVGMKVGDQWMPLVGADLERIETYRPHVQQIANATGAVVQLIEFETRIDREKIGPKK